MTRADQILGFIAGFTNYYGWAPSVREIQTAFGLKSPSTVQSHLNRLVREGRLERGGGARQLRVVKP